MTREEAVAAGQIRMDQFRNSDQLSNQAQTAITAPDINRPSNNTAQATPQATTQPQGLTTVGGQPLAEFMSGGQQLDAQGRMIDTSVDRSFFNQQSADREARKVARPDFGEAQTRAAGTVTDRERRAARGEGISDADRRDIAKANMSGASAGDIARGDKVAGLNGINRVTGEPVKTEGTGLTFDQQLNLRKQEFTEAKTILDWEKADEVTKTKRTDEMNAEIAALTSAMDQGKTVQDVGERAMRGTNWKTAGLLSPLKFIGGTDAASLEGNLETIKADAFVANITDMRNNSPTGGSVGNVSDADLKQMQSLQRSFQQKQKPGDLKRNISEYLKLRNQVIERTSKRFTRNYGQENFNKYFGKNAEGSSSTSGSSTAIPNDRNVSGKADLYLLPSSK